jgi:hypothetical protein
MRRGEEKRHIARAWEELTRQRSERHRGRGVAVIDALVATSMCRPHLGPEFVRVVKVVKKLGCNHNADGPALRQLGTVQGIEAQLTTWIASAGARSESSS